MTKVSVIVAAYCSGDGLDRVVASLDAQSLPQDEFESIFVDDGSPDDTLERLRALAASRPNMRVTSIPNSGWPCRPRNVGIEMAVGEYVTFMDHDDELYPDALRSAYEFAVEHRADVVNAKECHTSGWFWAFRQYQEDRVVGPDPNALLGMMPHKLYRRGLLVDHDVRFLDDGRVISEDILFNMEVVAHVERIGVLASQPFYTWVATGQNNSGSYTDDPDELWAALDRVLRHVEGLALPDEARDFMVLQTYKTRVLGRLLGPRLATRPESWRRRTFELVPGFLDQHVPPRFDEALGPFRRARADLLRAGRHDLLRTLAELDRGVEVPATAEEVAWSAEGTLVLGGEALWRGGDGEPWRVDLSDGRVRRRLPQDLQDALSTEALDLTDGLDEAVVTCVVKSLQDSTDWSLPTTHRVHVDEVASGGHAVRIEVGVRAPLDTVVFGRPLPDRTWKVGLRVDMFAGERNTPVRYAGPARVALCDGRVRVAEGKNGNLRIGVGTGPGPLLRATRPAVAQARVRRSGPWASRVTIPVREATVVGESRLPLALQLRPVDGGRPVSARGHLVADADGARLEMQVRLRPGRYRLAVEEPTTGADDGRVWLTPAVLTCSRTLGVSVDRVPVKGKGKRVWGRQV